ncbi:hypothetical protein GCM10028832_44380 [Streptomyces sparsus]
MMHSLGALETRDAPSAIRQPPAPAYHRGQPNGGRATVARGGPGAAAGGPFPNPPRSPTTVR